MIRLDKIKDFLSSQRTNYLAIINSEKPSREEIISVFYKLNETHNDGLLKWAKHTNLIKFLVNNYEEYKNEGIVRPILRTYNAIKNDSSSLENELYFTACLAAIQSNHTHLIRNLDMKIKEQKYYVLKGYWFMGWGDDDPIAELGETNANRIMQAYIDSDYEFKEKLKNTKFTTDEVVGFLLRKQTNAVFNSNFNYEIYIDKKVKIPTFVVQQIKDKNIKLNLPPKEQLTSDLIKKIMDFQMWDLVIMDREQKTKTLSIVSGEFREHPYFKETMKILQDSHKFKNRTRKPI